MTSKNRSKEASEGTGREGGIEKASRVLRNINVLGAVAAVGAGVVFPALAVPLNIYAGFNAVQAGGFEWARQSAKKSRERRQRN